MKNLTHLFGLECHKDRLKSLDKLTSTLGTDPLIKMVEYITCDSLDEVDTYFKAMLKKGEEGLVVKNQDALWKDGTSKDQIKFKEFHPFEMKVVGYNMGSGAHSEGIGSLLIESSCGRIKSSVTGLELAQKGLQRVDENNSAAGLEAIPGFDLNMYTGMIVEVKATSVSKSKTNDFLSLSLPNIVKFRPDKLEADDAEYIQGLFIR